MRFSRLYLMSPFWVAMVSSVHCLFVWSVLSHQMHLGIRLGKPVAGIVLVLGGCILPWMRRASCENCLVSSAIGSAVVLGVEIADVLSDGLTGARVDSCWVLGGLETFIEGVEMLVVVAEVEVAGSLPSRIARSLL